jgi:hypothetical protein
MAHILGAVLIYHSIRAHLCSSTRMVKTTNFLHKCTFHLSFSLVCIFELTMMVICGIFFRAINNSSLIFLLLTFFGLVLHFMIHRYLMIWLIRFLDLDT